MFADEALGIGESLFPPEVRGLEWIRKYIAFHRTLMDRAKEINAESRFGQPNVDGADEDHAEKPASRRQRLFASVCLLYRRISAVAPLGQLAYGVIATCLLVLFQFLQPFLQGVLIDKAVRAGVDHQQGKEIDIADLRPVLTMLFCLIVGNYLAEVFQCVFFAIFGYTAVTRLRAKFFANVIQQDMTFHDVHASGELSSRLVSDSAKLQDLLQFTLQRLINGSVQFVVALAAMYWTNPMLALTATVITPVNVVIMKKMGQLAGHYGAVQNDALASASAYAVEVLGSVRTVQSNTGEYFEAESFRAKLNYVLRVIKATVYTENLFRSAQMGLQQLRDFAILIYGLHQVIMGELSIGSYTAFMAYVKQYETGFSQLSDIWVQVKQTVTSLAKFMELLSRPAAISLEGGNEPSVCLGHVQLVNVSFHYKLRADYAVVSEVSFEALPGSIVALVGESGAGKSTIARLLERHYDPSSGQVLLDGHDYRDLNLRWLRTQIGFVEQEPVLFNRPVRENIAYGDLMDTPLAAIQEAARLANAHDFIMDLAEGYDTTPGERAARISGGQKQRIAIARAILRNPKVLLLDEATSALDSENEHVVQQALNNLMIGKTTIIIAHRLSTIVQATKIVVLHQGRVVEQGTHAELSSRPASKFFSFMRHQLGAL